MSTQIIFIIIISFTILLYLSFLGLGFLLRNKNIKAQNIDK